MGRAIVTKTAAMVLAERIAGLEASTRKHEFAVMKAKGQIEENKAEMAKLKRKK